MVVQRTFNALVAGSNPVILIIEPTLVRGPIHSRVLGSAILSGSQI